MSTMRRFCAGEGVGTRRRLKQNGAYLDKPLTAIGRNEEAGEGA